MAQADPADSSTTNQKITTQDISYNPDGRDSKILPAAIDIPVERNSVTERKNKERLEELFTVQMDCRGA